MDNFPLLRCWRQKWYIQFIMLWEFRVITVMRSLSYFVYYSILGWDEISFLESILINFFYFNIQRCISDQHIKINSHIYLFQKKLIIIIATQYSWTMAVPLFFFFDINHKINSPKQSFYILYYKILFDQQTSIRPQMYNFLSPVLW